MSPEIRKLDILLTDHLLPNEIIKDTSYTSLTKAGDNYGSIMLKLDVTILNKKNNEERILNLVAKILPESELFREIFKIQTTYTNEMAFYNTIVPTLQNFLTEIGAEAVDLFPKCYGARTNLLENGSDVIDDDAVLLMENLKIKGYTNVDRKIGFNFQVTKLLLRDLASFHAGFLSMKLQKPDLFNERVRAFCENYEPGKTVKFKNIKDIFKEICKENSDCIPLTSQYEVWGARTRNEPREPFATVIHSDLWVNNMMHLFEKDEVVANKFVDFQIFTYGSPAADVFFLLFTSVQYEVLKNHLDYLLQLYHTELILNLEKHKSKIDFSYQQFLEEIEKEAVYEYSHAMAFFLFLHLEAETEKYPDDYKKIAENSPLAFKEKLWFMVTECNKRRWLPSSFL